MILLLYSNIRNVQLFFNNFCLEMKFEIILSPYLYIIYFLLTSSHEILVQILSYKRCLVSLFNGISTLFGLFNAKAILLEEQ